MLFNSFAFLVFFPLVCTIYFLIPVNKWRNIFLLLASYYFYMSWNPTYAILIFTSTLVTWGCGLLVEKHAGNQRKKKVFLVLNLLINLGILFIFKYYNFINESIFQLLGLWGIRWEVPGLGVLLPVGISFYTFQAIGYSIDVYRGDLKAERNLFVYALFVSFFPQLVAGPIERAKNLLPQFYHKHAFNPAFCTAGLQMMLWGYFMKLCVSDRIAMYVDTIYNHVAQHNGTSLILATFLFTIQIYCDFAGYSLIAIGAAKVMGFSLMENFRRPYFSASMREFWKRWHISLSTWFMDYVYIPLGGNRVPYARHLLNLLITFLVSGLWHGASWTFVCWGGLHGIFLVIENLKNRYIGKAEQPNAWRRLLSILWCFAFVSFAWIFFRANNVGDAFEIIRKIFTQHGSPFMNLEALTTLGYGFSAILILFFKDFTDEYLPGKFLVYHNRHIAVRFSAYLLTVIFIVSVGVLDGGQFIYFQF